MIIAERHRTIAQSLSSLVMELGNVEVVAEVNTAAEALEIGQTLAPDVAIIDLDLSPNSSLVSSLIETSPDTRIVVLGDRDRGTPLGLVDALALGAVGAIYRDECHFMTWLRPSARPRPRGQWKLTKRPGSS